MEFDQPYLLGPLFGDYDRHLITIENRLAVHIAARGNKVQIEGEPDAASRAREVLIGLYNRLDQGHDVDAEAVEAVLGMAAQPNLDGIISEEVASPPRVMIRTRKKTIVPRSPVQTIYMEALARDDMIFALGPAGTGKTYLAVAQAVSQLITGSVDRLILSRPAVEAGERLGFLPGDMKEKVDPYLRPLYDALYDMLPTEQVERRIATGEIEIAPLAFMRGRTLERCLHHPRRGAEHDSAANENVPDPFRNAQPNGDLRRSAPGRPSRSKQVGSCRRGLSIVECVRALQSLGSLQPTSCAIRSSAASSKPMKGLGGDAGNRRRGRRGMGQYPLLGRARPRAVEAAIAESAVPELATAVRPVEVSVLLTGDEKVRDLNAEYRGKHRPTNVLSFPMVEAEDLHGANVAGPRTVAWRYYSCPRRLRSRSPRQETCASSSTRHILSSTARCTCLATTIWKTGEADRHGSSRNSRSQAARHRQPV